MKVTSDEASRAEPLLKAGEVAVMLGVVPRYVFQLPIRQVRIATKCVRWRRQDVEAFIESKLEAAR